MVLLRNLQSRDLASLVGLDPDGEAIRYAYPFTETPTGHRVELKTNVLNALCLIDALGVASMYGTEITVESSCRQCGQRLRFTTADKGRALSDLSRTEAVVWYDLAYSDSAAASCCPAIAFFCSDEHLRRWLNAKTLSARRAWPSVSTACAIQGSSASTVCWCRLSPIPPGLRRSVPGNRTPAPFFGVSPIVGKISRTLPPGNVGFHSSAQIRHALRKPPAQHVDTILPEEWLALKHQCRHAPVPGTAKGCIILLQG